MFNYIKLKFFIRLASSKRVSILLNHLSGYSRSCGRLELQIQEILIAALSRIVVWLVWSSVDVACLEDHMVVGSIRSEISGLERNSSLVLLVFKAARFILTCCRISFTIILISQSYG